MIKRREQSIPSINKDTVLKALTAVKPGIAKEEFISQATNFIFTGDSVASYNDYVCVTYPLNTNISCMVDSDRFYKFVKGLPDEPIQFKLSENQLSVNTKSVRSAINVVMESDIVSYIDKLSDEMKDVLWKKVPDDFIKGISMCLFSVAKDVSINLANILVKETYIYTSDTMRVSRYTLNKQIIRDDILIPYTVAVNLIKYELTECCVSENWIHFKTKDNAIFSFRKVISSFPDCSKFFNLKGKKISLNADLSKVVKNVSIFTDKTIEMDKTIHLRFEKNKLTCRAEDSVGWEEQDVSINYDGEKFDLDVHPTFLYQALDKAVDIIIGDTKAMLSTNKFDHVMMLQVKE